MYPGTTEIQAALAPINRGERRYYMLPIGDPKETEPNEAKIINRGDADEIMTAYAEATGTLGVWWYLIRNSDATRIQAERLVNIANAADATVVINIHPYQGITDWSTWTDAHGRVLEECRAISYWLKDAVVREPFFFVDFEPKQSFPDDPRKTIAQKFIAGVLSNLKSHLPFSTCMFYNATHRYLDHEDKVKHPYNIPVHPWIMPWGDVPNFSMFHKTIGQTVDFVTEGGAYGIPNIDLGSYWEYQGIHKPKWWLGPRTWTRRCAPDMNWYARELHDWLNSALDLPDACIYGHNYLEPRYAEALRILYMGA